MVPKPPRLPVGRMPPTQPPRRAARSRVEPTPRTQHHAPPCPAPRAPPDGDAWQSAGGNSYCDPEDFPSKLAALWAEVLRKEGAWWQRGAGTAEGACLAGPARGRACAHKCACPQRLSAGDAPHAPLPRRPAPDFANAGLDKDELTTLKAKLTGRGGQPVGRLTGLAARHAWPGRHAAPHRVPQPAAAARCQPAPLLPAARRAGWGKRFEAAELEFESDGDLGELLDGLIAAAPAASDDDSDEEEGEEDEDEDSSD